MEKRHPSYNYEKTISWWQLHKFEKQFLKTPGDEK